MDGGGLTVFDTVTLGLLLFSGLVGFGRGVLREVFSAGAFVAAAFGCVFGFPFVKGPVRAMVSPDWAADLVGLVALFMIIYITVRLFSGQIATLIRDGFKIGALDRALGFGFGLLRGLLIVALGVIIFEMVTPADRMPKWLVTAKTYPMVQNAAGFLRSLAPDDAAARLTSKPGESALPPVTADDSDESYAGSDRRSLDQLITTTTE